VSYAPGMASMEQRSGSWRVYWRLGGRDGRKQSVTASSKRRAETVKAFVEDRAHRVTDDECYRTLFPGFERNADMPALRDWVATWHSGKDNVQPDVLAGYMQLLTKWVLPRLGDYQLDALDVDVIADWVKWMKVQKGRSGRPLSPDTVRRAHAVLHQVLGSAVPKFLPANPAAKPAGSRKGVTGLPPHVAYEATFLTPAEGELILAACDRHVRDLVEVALFTGLRLGELIVLRVLDVELNATEPAIFVRRALKADGTIGGPKSARSRRTVTLSERAAATLARCVQGKPRSALVFTSPTGLMWSKDNVRERHWKRAVAAAKRCIEHPPPRPERVAKTGPIPGYRITDVSTCDCPGRLGKTPRFHDTRHSAAAWLIEAKWDVFVISRRLGHESIKTTFDIYGHLIRQGGAEGLEALDRLAA